MLGWGFDEMRVISPLDDIVKSCTIFAPLLQK